jgi:nitrogen PTS system EIIA component
VVRKWISERDLPVHRVSERLHMNAIEVWEWAVERGIPVSRKLLDEARRTPDAVPPLSSLLESGGVHRDIGGEDKPSTLAHMVQQIPLPPDADREHLLAVLEAREAMGSTGIGDGIAIPHVRNPILLHVNRPQVSAFLLRTPVDFDAIDAQPVHTIFLVISSTVPGHLKILAQLGYLLRDASLRDLFRRQAPTDAILAHIRALEHAAGGPAAAGGTGT